MPLPTERPGLIEGDIVRPPLAADRTVREGFRLRSDDYVIVEYDEGRSEALPLSVAERWERGTRARIPMKRLEPDTAKPELVPSEELRMRLEKLVFDSGRPWSPLLKELVPAIDAWGYDLWVVGGAVRDVLLGKDPADIKDLDLAGTAPPQRMRRIIEGVIERNPEFALDGWWVNVSGENVLHVTAGPRKFEAGGGAGRAVHGSFLQYLALRGRYERGATGKGRWYSGADLAKDCTFRDVTINALFYDVGKTLLHSPSNQYLSDLGLQAGDVENWSEPTSGPRRGVIRPIDLLPADVVPDNWAVKGLARTVKSVSRYQDWDCTPVREWLDRHTGRIGDDLGRRVRGRGGMVHLPGEGALASYLKSYGVDVDDLLIRQCAERGFPDDVLRVMENARERVHLGATAEQLLRGWGLRHLEEFNGGMYVGDDVLPGSGALEPESVTATLMPVIGGGGERVEFEVNYEGVSMRVVGIDAPFGRFVEVDANGDPLPVDRPW